MYENHNSIKLHLLFYKEPVYKQLALGWQIAKQLSEFNPFSTKQQ